MLYLTIIPSLMVVVLLEILINTVALLFIIRFISPKAYLLSSQIYYAQR